MKMKLFFKFVWLTILICIVNSVNAMGQNNDYLVLDQSLADKLAEKVLENNAKDVDSKDISWAKDLIRKTFKEYFANAVPKNAVYGQERVDTLQKYISELSKEKKNWKDSMAIYEASLSTLKDKYKKVESKCKEEFSIKESELRNKLIEQEKRVDSLTRANEHQDSLMKSLEEDAKIARSIIDKLNEKQKVLDQFFMGSFNASLDFINADYVSRVSQAVEDYENYVSLVELPVVDDVKEKLYFLKGISSVAVFYHESIAFMDTNFDKKHYDALLKDYAELNNNGVKLNTVQNTQFVQIGEALAGLQESGEHFQQEVLRVLKDQGLMPDAETVDNVRSRVNLMIKLFTAGDFMSNDRYYYNSYYKNLNRVVDKAHDTLREMNKTEYQDYLTKLKKSL